LARNLSLSTLRTIRIPRVWLVAGGGWVGRAMQILAQLAAVRIMTDSLGVSGYGAFAVLVSLNGWLILSDLCIATGLQNFVSQAKAAGSQVNDIVITAAVLSLAATCASLLLLLLAGPFLSRALLGNFSSLAQNEMLFAFYAVCLCIGASALGSIAYRVWFAEHRGYLSNLLPAVATVAGTMLLWLAARQDFAQPLTASVLAYYLPVAIIPLVALGMRIRDAARRGRFNGALVGPLLQRGFRFWIFGVLAAGVLQVDYIVMSQVLEEADIALYSIVARLFAMVLFMYSALLAALWPLCTEMASRRDWDSLIRAMRRYLLLGLAFAVLSGAVLLAINPWIMGLLSPALGIVVPGGIIVLMTVYVLIRIWTDTFAMVLQSMDDLRVLWIVTPVQSLLSIGLQTVGAQQFGLVGLICGLIACFVLTTAWALPYRVLHHVRSPLS